MKRQKTDSVTHLVKVIAAEVFDEKIDGLIEDKIKEARSGPKNAKNAGLRWVAEEDRQLCDSLSDFICNMAHEHERTYGSIRARIKLLLR